MVKRSTTVWCLNPLMWLKQCNKPAMTGNGLSIAPTKKCWFFSGGWCVDALIVGNVPTKNFGNLPNGWCLSHVGMTDHFYWIKLGHLDPSWHHPVGISPPKNAAVTRAPCHFSIFQQCEINLQQNFVPWNRGVGENRHAPFNRIIFNKSSPMFFKASLPSPN